MTHEPALRDLIDSTRWIDTHEHIVEEQQRLKTEPYRFPACTGGELVIPADWTCLLVDYSLNDLITAGLPQGHAAQVLEDGIDPADKWQLVEPYWEAARTTGYVRAVDLTTERLFDMRLCAETCVEIDARLRAMRQPGYFRHVIRDVARVDWCQVHSVDQEPFCETETPDLLEQDLSIVPLVFGRHDEIERRSGRLVSSLSDYVAVIEWCFREYARRAIAVKCLWAYFRPLEVQSVAAPPQEAFSLLRAGRATERQQRDVQDYLFDVCIRLATEFKLPVKMHLGYLDSIGRREMRFVRDHVSALIPLAQRYPDTTFVLMHMSWPHHDELIAVAKHHPNVIVDLCWSWILAPLATRTFVSRFLTSVPSTKLLGFGGDYLVPENLVGHAAIARAGLAGALEDLVDSDWLSLAEACELVPRLMRTNAERIFPRPRREPSQSAQQVNARRHRDSRDCTERCSTLGSPRDAIIDA